MNGAELIAAERERQIEDLGFDADHDSQYVAGQLASASTCYALLGVYCYEMTHHMGYEVRPSEIDAPPKAWPWSIDHWKPSDDLVENLVRAGALIAAEIDRLLPA